MNNRNSILFIFEEEFFCEILIKLHKPFNPFLIIKILLSIPAVVPEIFPSPVSHTAHVCAGFKVTIIYVVMLDGLPDVGINGKGFHFLKSEKKHAVGNLFPYSAKPHKAFPRIPVFQAEKHVKIQLARRNFFGCGFYVMGPEAKFAFVKLGWIGICKSLRDRKAKIAWLELLPEKLAEQVDSFLDCGNA